MQRQKAAGSILPMTLIILLAIGLLVATQAIVSITSLRSVTDETRRLQAFYAANSGLERAQARIAARLTTFTSGTSDASIATQLASTVNTSAGVSSGTVEGGSFVVTATSSADIVTLRSRGKATGDVSTRVVTMQLRARGPVVSTSDPFRAGAPAALITASRDTTNTGDAPIAGTVDANPADTLNFGLTCTPSAQASTCLASGTPASYVLSAPTASVCSPVTTPGSNCLHIGEYLTVPNFVGAQYVVSNITPGTNGRMNVEVTAVSETARQITSYQNVTNCVGQGRNQTCTTTQVPVLSAPGSFPLRFGTGNALTLTRRDTAPSIMTGSFGTDPRVQGNAGDPCAAYSCEKYTFAPSHLFETIFGMTKSDFLGAMPASSVRTGGQDSCPASSGPASARVTWWNITNSSGQVDLLSCATPRVMVIDARSSGANKLNISTGAQGEFRGLLYIIGGNKNIDIVSNGAFRGSVVAETSVDPAASYEVKASGTGNNAACRQLVPTGNQPKLCHDPAMLDGLTQLLSNVVVPPPSRPASAARVQDSWQEVSGQ